jgi:hypothetical protein
VAADLAAWRGVVGVPASHRQPDVPGRYSLHDLLRDYAAEPRASRRFPTGGNVIM